MHPWTRPGSTCPNPSCPPRPRAPTARPRREPATTRSRRASPRSSPSSRCARSSSCSRERAWSTARGWWVPSSAWGSQGSTCSTDRAASAPSPRSTATAFPVAMMRGATWDPVARGAAWESAIADRGALPRRRRAARAPTMNILRHPRWGRAQETYSEDTHHLGSHGASPSFEGVQSRGVLASAKHFAANSIEDSRHRRRRARGSSARCERSTSPTSAAPWSTPAWPR
jgi:hypothetical protein